MANILTKRVVRFDQALTLPRAEAIRTQLLDALEGDAPVEIDCSAAAEIDISFIQILCAARHAAAARGKQIALAPPPSGALLHALQRGGFVPAEGTSRNPEDAFWAGQGEKP